MEQIIRITRNNQNNQNNEDIGSISVEIFPGTSGDEVKYAIRLLAEMAMKRYLEYKQPKWDNGVDWPVQNTIMEINDIVRNAKAGAEVAIWEHFKNDRIKKNEMASARLAKLYESEF